MSDPFSRLAPFIQDYIYRAKWDELRPIQVMAIEAILDTPNHLLITSGTASGKTEAAFLPILTELHEHPSLSIGAMYIGPLKALINDQFYRLNDLLQESQIPVQSWHGDIAQSKKTKFLKRGQGILQITPESLEAMLINRQTELGRLFGDLRFVVIDELHAFIGSDRGRQVLCQLQRLARYQKQLTRRIGLSATLGEPELAMEWLRGGTDLAVTHLNDTVGRREILLGLEHFVRHKEEVEVADDESETLLSSDETLFEEFEESPEQMLLLPDETDALFKHMLTMVQSVKKTLIFANSRNETEEIIHNLRRQAAVETEDEDNYYVHHGSISSAIRERAEEDMRNPNIPTCVAATITLELGIDIGNLDQVLQLNASSTVSSFVQRLGRTGRRGSAAKMFFYSSEDVNEENPTLGEQIPWGLLQLIAVVQLYLEEKWIEPPEVPKLPTSLLYHQTMSILNGKTELTPPKLAEYVLSLSPFQAVSQDQFRTLLLHLLEIDHLERIEGGGLIVGAASERMVNNYHFYATFENETEYQVREGSREIGTIQSVPAIDDRFRLAGRAWRVLDINEEKHIIFVERVKGRAQSYWSGGGANIHTRILQRMCLILQEDKEYGYLQSRALERLRSARQLARHTGMTTRSVLPLGEGRFMLLPWRGSRTVETLALLLIHGGMPTQIRHSPYYLVANASDMTPIQDLLRELVQNPPSPEALIEGMSSLELLLNKYDRYVPETLLREAYVIDHLDMKGALESIYSLMGN